MEVSQTTASNVFDINSATSSQTAPSQPGFVSRTYNSAKATVSEHPAITAGVAGVIIGVALERTELGHKTFDLAYKPFAWAWNNTIGRIGSKKEKTEEKK